MLIFILNLLSGLRNMLCSFFVSFLCSLFSFLHELYSKSQSQKTGNPIKFKNFPFLRFYLCSGIIFPEMIMSQLIICNFFKDLFIFRITGFCRYFFINMIFFYFIFLELLNISN